MVQVRELSTDADFADDEIWLTEDEDESKFKGRKTYDEDLDNETYFDRIKALEFMVPYSIRRRIEGIVSTTFNITLTISKLVGRVTWSVITSSLLLAVPTMIAYDSESFWNQIEAEQKLHGGVQGGPPPPAHAVPVPLPSK
jgi:import receptor subunit TOM22